MGIYTNYICKVIKYILREEEESRTRKGNLLSLLRAKTSFAN